MPFLDYIFTIDIFNEGVDIPEINQVLMLRPTESPIIFVQQLGRGLRKAEGKCFFYQISTKLMAIGSLLCIFGSLIQDIGTELCTGWTG